MKKINYNTNTKIILGYKSHKVLANKIKIILFQIIAWIEEVETPKWRVHSVINVLQPCIGDCCRIPIFVIDSINSSSFSEVNCFFGGFVSWFEVGKLYFKSEICEFPVVRVDGLRHLYIYKAGPGWKHSATFFGIFLFVKPFMGVMNTFRGNVSLNVKLLRGLLRSYGSLDWLFYKIFKGF